MSEIGDTPIRITLIRAGSEFFGLLFFVAALVVTAGDPDNGGKQTIAENIVMGTVIMLSMQHSGSYFNPAVNINFLLRGTIKYGECFFLMVVQIISVFIGAVVSYYLYGWALQPAFKADGAEDYIQFFLNEAFFTFLLVFFLNIQTTPDTAFSEHPMYTGLMFMILLNTWQCVKSCIRYKVFKCLCYKQLSFPLAARLFDSDYTGMNDIWLWVFAPIVGSISGWALFEYLYHPHAKKIKSA